MKYICYIDTETTGLPEQQSGNILIQLAYIVYDLETNSLVMLNEDYNKPENPLTSKAMSMHHITPEMLEDTKPLQQTTTYTVLKSFLEEHGDEVVICAHNLNFDFQVLERVLDLSQVRKLDTLKIARMINDRQGLVWENCQLQYLKYELKLYQGIKSLTSELGIDKPLSAHDAMSDIIDLILLVKYFKDVYKATIPLMVSITEGPPLMLQHMPSGKDKGTKIVDLSYNQLVWHSENSYDEHVKYTCQRHLINS